MKRQLSIILLLFTFAFSVSAQENVMSFSTITSPINCDELRAEIDDYFIRLQNYPEYFLFFIYYEGKYKVPVYSKGKIIKMREFLPIRGEAENVIQAIRDHIRIRKFDSSRIWLINGGYREEFEIEPLLFTKNTKLPQPKPMLDKMQFREGKLPKFTCIFE